MTGDLLLNIIILITHTQNEASGLYRPEQLGYKVYSDCIVIVLF